MRTLLYHCPAGISGDMNLAAMVALGVDPAALEAELRKLPYSGWSLEFEQNKRQGISGLNCKVVLEKEHEHDDHHHHGHHHHHRTYREIREAIEFSELASEIKKDALACFAVLAEAEGAVHGIEPDQVHFHEVGALDSIVDMVGAAICWHLLKINRIACSTLEVGGGTVQCAHGTMPVPAPATARLLEGVPFTAGATDKECTTPTGAALLIGKACAFQTRIAGTQIKSVIATGHRDDPKLANALYLSLLETSDATNESDHILELATNIDDMTAEATAFLCEQIMEAGALDCWQTPATFKKGRLGCIVHALVAEDQLENIEACIFKHSRTLGIRHQRWERSKLSREIQTLETPWGPVRIKTATLPDGSKRHKIEHEDAARIAREQNQSLAQIEAQLADCITEQKP
ncbi:MAG: nickel pincer cofactor biosynthesis protein LarC [Verrucomicrobia bacterium]|nr:nickel pincer cofactor biosynthesis protein LarC [Verrucomicrobiota bacterium]